MKIRKKGIVRKFITLSSFSPSDFLFEFICYIVVLCYLLKIVKGKSNRNCYIIRQQFKDIEETFFKNVLKVLHDILNIFPVVKDIVILSKQLLLLVRLSHDNNVKEIKGFMNPKKCKLEQFYQET